VAAEEGELEEDRAAEAPAGRPVAPAEVAVAAGD
jgi:hypothetical protein